MKTTLNKFQTSTWIMCTREREWKDLRTTHSMQKVSNQPTTPTLSRELSAARLLALRPRHSQHWELTLFARNTTPKDTVEWHQALQHKPTRSINTGSTIVIGPRNQVKTNPKGRTWKWRSETTGNSTTCTATWTTLRSCISNSPRL